MYSRRKIIANSLGRDCATLREAIGKFTEITAAQRAAAEKDFLLVEGALNGDNIIFSIDDRSRDIYCLIGAHVRDFGNIYWVNPV